MKKYKDLKSLYSSSIISNSDKMSSKRLEEGSKSRTALHERILKRYQKISSVAKKRKDGSKGRKSVKVKQNLNASVLGDITSLDYPAMNESLISLNPKLTSYQPNYKLIGKGRNSTKFLRSTNTELYPKQHSSIDRKRSPKKHKKSKAAVN